VRAHHPRVVRGDKRGDAFLGNLPAGHPGTGVLAVHPGAIVVARRVLRAHDFGNLRKSVAVHGVVAQTHAVVLRDVLGHVLVVVRDAFAVGRNVGLEELGLFALVARVLVAAVHIFGHLVRHLLQERVDPVQGQEHGDGQEVEAVVHGGGGEASSEVVGVVEVAHGDDGVRD